MPQMVFRWLAVLALGLAPAAAQIAGNLNLTEPDPPPRRHLQFDLRGADERELFYVAYGDMLFHSPQLFGEKARAIGLSCAACHTGGDVNRNLFIPSLSSGPGSVDTSSPMFNPAADNHRFDPFDIPSLRGIRFTAPYGRDGRIASLREFTRMVIVQEFAGPEPTPLMLDALVAFLNEVDFLPAPFLNRDGTLDDRAPAAAKRGEVLFNKPFPQMMGGMSCASCHIPSANFIDGRRHDIGAGRPSSRYARDSVYDTPTLLGAAHTAPYFHDGSIDTLADVVFWFDSRFSLGLTEVERADLTAYLEAVGTGEAPFADKPPDLRPVFLAPLTRLMVAHDRFHAALLLRSIARDAALDALLKAIEEERWPEADRIWEAFRRTEGAN